MGPSNTWRCLTHGKIWYSRRWPRQHLEGRSLHQGPSTWIREAGPQRFGVARGHLGELAVSLWEVSLTLRALPKDRAPTVAKDRRAGLDSGRCSGVTTADPVSWLLGRLTDLPQAPFLASPGLGEPAGLHIRGVSPWEISWGIGEVLNSACHLAER